METRAIRAALAATALLLLAAMPGPSVAQDDPDQARFTLVERADTDVVVDLGEDGDSVGDLLVFGNELYDEANETVVGRDQGSCVRTNPGRRGSAPGRTCWTMARSWCRVRSTTTCGIRCWR